MLEREHGELTLRRQSELLGMSRSSVYYQARPESAETQELMRWIDRQYVKTPFYGVRRMAACLRRVGRCVDVKRVRRLMRLMGLEAVYPRRGLSQAVEGDRKWPYLLKGIVTERADQVWSTDITYIPLSEGWMYLTAVMDWHSRYILSWELSNTLEADFCVMALQRALGSGRKPEIFNTDQGSQFTSVGFTGVLSGAGIRISMDGKGRAFDNIFVERLWRSVKYEEVYMKSYRDVVEARNSLGRYFAFYNDERPHQSLGYGTPAEAYHGAADVVN